MNGAHDVGGMQDLGPIPYEKDPPVFHSRWESRVQAMQYALFSWHKWNLATTRWMQEKIIPPSDYFRMSYYERWYTGIVQLLLDSKLITRAEAESGKPDQGSARLTPPLTADQVVAFFAKPVSVPHGTGGKPARFAVGQRVRTRNMNPPGHTRLPRYARGRLGEIHRDHGVFPFEDTNATFMGENAQHVYSVRFTARELWGDRAPAQDRVYLDLWDDYLEPV